MSKTETLYTKIAGESASVNVEFVTVDSAWLSMRVASREDALLACYCYAPQKTKIERAANGQYLVVVYKSRAAA